MGDQHICYHYGLYPLLLWFLRPDRWHVYSKALDYLASLGFYIFISVSTQWNLWSLKTLHAMSYTSVFTSCLFPYVLILWALWLNKFLKYLSLYSRTPSFQQYIYIFLYVCVISVEIFPHPQLSMQMTSYSSSTWPRTGFFNLSTVDILG